MELVLNAEIILTKNAIIGKVKTLLASLQPAIEDTIQQQAHFFSAETLLPRPKISRGDNYMGLPYLILDYPRCFDKENILAIRTMFWWGNHFSVTLHLAGKYKDLYQPKIINRLDNIANNEFFIGIHQHQWEHHFEKNNYKAVKEFAPTEWKELIRQQEFVKLAQKIPLTKWDGVENILLEEYAKLVMLLVD